MAGKTTGPTPITNAFRGKKARIRVITTTQLADRLEVVLMPRNPD